MRIPKERVKWTREVDWSERVGSIGLNSLEPTMLMVRLLENKRAKAWRAMMEVGPVRLEAPDHIYEVLPPHAEMLIARTFTFEVVPRPNQVE